MILAGRNCPLVVHTSMCGWAITCDRTYFVCRVVSCLVLFLAIGVERWMALVGLDLVNPEVVATKSEVVMNSPSFVCSLRRECSLLL